MMHPEGFWWLNGVIGWLRFWLIPRLLRTLLIWLVAWLIVWLLDRCFRVWLHPTLVGAKDRDAAKAIWRQRQILAMPGVLSRGIVGALVIWLTAELFGVPREGLLWAFAAGALGVFWAGRSILLDLAAGYALLLDDVVIEGDRLALPYGEGTVERMTLFHVHLRLNEGTTLVIPHHILRGGPIKVQRAISQTVRR